MKDNLKEYKDLFLPGAIVLAAIILGGSLVWSGGINIVSKEGTGAIRATASAVPARTVDNNGSTVEFTVTKEDHILGNPDAPITIVEFSDLECPFCKRFHTTMKQALAEYSGKVRWVYKHFPLDQIHSKADKEAEATECAGELGGNKAFWQYVDKIFEITPSNNNLDLALLPQVAEDMGLDRASFEACLASGKYAEHVEDDYQQGLRAGVTGTPGSYVNGVPVRGAVPYGQLKSIIDSQL